MIPIMGGTQRLSKLIGRMNATQYILHSKEIQADQAKKLGIVVDVFKN